MVIPQWNIHIELVRAKYPVYQYVALVGASARWVDVTHHLVMFV